MKQVRCVSPHGGCRNGQYANGDPVHCLPDGTLPDAAPDGLRLPPNPGGYIDDARIPGGTAAVGTVYDVDDGFDCYDGFHFEEVTATGTQTEE